jgi:hypothetical protein
LSQGDISKELSWGHFYGVATRLPEDLDSVNKQS